jgi:TonB family protein
VIWIQTTIAASGSASRTRLSQGGHPALESEALTVVQNLDFRPATRNEVPVPSRVQIPVIFEGPYRTPEEEER